MTEAIEHAVAAGAFDEAGELIAAAWVEYVYVNRYATVVAMAERFPRERLRQDSRLLLAGAWVYTLSGQRQAAAEAIAAIELLGRLDEGPLPDGFSSVEAGLATLRGLVTWGDIGAGMQNARRAAELEGPASRWRPAVCLGLGFQTLQHGRARSVRRLARRVGRACTIARTVVGRLGRVGLPLARRRRRGPGRRSDAVRRGGCARSNESAASTGSTARRTSRWARRSQRSRGSRRPWRSSSAASEYCAPRVTRSRSRPG